MDFVINELFLHCLCVRTMTCQPWLSVSKQWRLFLTCTTTSPLSTVTFSGLCHYCLSVYCNTGISLLHPHDCLHTAAANSQQASSNHMCQEYLSTFTTATSTINIAPPSCFTCITSLIASIILLPFIRLLRQWTTFIYSIKASFWNVHTCDSWSY